MFMDDLCFLRMRTSTMFILNCYHNSGLEGRSLLVSTSILGKQGGLSSGCNNTLLSPGLRLPLYCQQLLLWPLPAVKPPHQCCSRTSKSGIWLVSAQTPQQPCHGAEQHRVTAALWALYHTWRTTSIKAYTRLFSCESMKIWNQTRVSFVHRLVPMSALCKRQEGKSCHNTHLK